LLRDGSAHRDSGVGGERAGTGQGRDPMKGPRQHHCSERKETRMAAVSRRDFLKTAGAIGAGAAVGIGFPAVLRAQGGGSVKVGVLHSLSGTMAISEVSLRDVCMMAFDEINAKGGVMGKKIAPAVFRKSLRETAAIPISFRSEQ